MRPADHPAWLTFALVALVPLLLGAAGWFTSPPILDPDSATGFLVWESGHDGAPWNCLREPDPADIARNHDVFLTWWSPGQYVVPGWWRGAGFSWGQAMLLTALAGAWLQAGGCWWLARATGLGPVAAGWLTLTATLQWHTMHQFGYFRGGEILLAAAAPWLLALAWRLRQHACLTLVLAPGLVVLGQWLKLSALLLLVPLLTYLGLIHIGRLRARPRAAAGFVLGAAALMALTWWGMHVVFFARGPTPATASAPGGWSLTLVSYSLASPWLAITGLGSLMGRVCQWLGRDGDEIWRTAGWPVLTATLVVWWAAWRGWLGPLPVELRRFIGWVLAGNIVLLALLYARGASISIDDRHVRPAATLLLVGAAVTATSSARRWRRGTQAVLLTCMVYGLGAAVPREIALARIQSQSRAGFCQQEITAAALVRLARLTRDTPPTDTVVYVPAPEIALEVNGARRISTDDINRDLAAVRAEHWRGRVPRLIVVVSDAMEKDGRGGAVRAAFADYPPAAWQAETAGGWWFWTAETPHV